MGMHEEAVINRICEIYGEISNLKSLKPSKDANRLFTELVSTCIPPCSIDVNTLSMKAQAIRSKLIKLCGEAEGHLESHFSDILATYEKPLDHLNIFPYYNNYLKLSFLEFNILCQHVAEVPNSIAFVGSGPLPLTTIILALNHLRNTEFHNYDIDPSANSKAKRLIVQHPDLSKRMFFHNRDVMDMGDDDDHHVNCKQLKDYDVVFLAALVGMDNQEKVKIVTYLSKHMAPGSVLMLRSAHGSRAFLYPVVEPSDLHGFEVLSVYHPIDEVINSVIIARRSPFLVNPNSNSIEFEPLPLNGGGGGIGGGMMMLQKYHTSKCAEIECFHPLAHVVVHGHGVGVGVGGMMMMEEVGINEEMIPS